MNEALRKLRMDVQPPALEVVLVGARTRMLKRQRLRSLGGAAAGIAVAALAVLIPSSGARAPGQSFELHGQACEEALCTAWCPMPAVPESPGLCGVHEVACLSGCSNG